MDIVMVHGIWDTGAIYRRMAQHLIGEGHRCLRPDLKPANGTLGLKDLAEKLRATIDAEMGPTGPLAVIGFSMGAVIARHYLQSLGGAGRTSHFFSISGPHHGTLTAYLYPGKAARDMRYNSQLLKTLNSDPSSLERIEVTVIAPLSICSSCPRTAPGSKGQRTTRSQPSSTTAWLCRSESSSTSQQCSNRRRPPSRRTDTAE
jgi:triacylglycerol lipase